jgi:hypothetical protein
MENERQLALIKASRGSAARSTSLSQEPRLSASKSASVSRPPHAAPPATAATATATTTTNTPDVITSDPTSTSASIVYSNKSAGDVVFSELLAYVNHYRDTATAANIHKVVLNYYSIAEINEAKKQLINAFNHAIPLDSAFRTERRKSSARSAQDAEVEDVIGLFDLLDRQHMLNNDIKFAAVAIDRIPKYGPEELNIATMIDKQIHLESVIAELELKIDSMRSSVSDNVQSEQLNQIYANVTQFDSHLRKAVDNIDGQLNQFSAICHQLVNSASSKAHNNSNRVADDIDRSRNVVITGVPEERNKEVWFANIQRALTVAAGREVLTADAFRIGGRYIDGRTRPVLVKLQSAWDRRIVLQGARKLAQDITFRKRVYINADEPVEVRRKNMLTRLKNKAIREGKEVSVASDGTLVIDNKPVFNVNSGFIHVNDDQTTNVNG